MSDKTLGKARGLNSIANPRDFKGSPGRRRGAEKPPPPPAPSAEPEPRQEQPPPRDEAPRPTRAKPKARTTPASTEAPAPTEPEVVAKEQPKPDIVERTATPHRAVTPGINRKRRELSVPHKVAEALEQTGINPADIVMTGYRKHSDAIYAGAGGRMLAKGRTRLRISISDTEFEQLTRLGQARGWNRSETVGVILAMELLTPASPEPSP